MGLLNNICKDENIKLIEFTDEISEMLTNSTNFKGAGRAVAQGDNKYIFFDSTAQYWEKRFIVAHEVAHHLLGHLRTDTTITPQDRENEANIFASVLVGLLIFKEYESRGI